MGIAEIFLTALSLAMDAFAVSVTNGAAVADFKKRYAVKMGLYFGVFQFVMPLVGYALGSSFRRYIEAFDHWIAFGLLAQAVATSIDALAVGISFSLLPGVNMWLSCSIIGIVAFVLSFAGGIMGRGIGGFLKDKAELAGGIALVGIGLKILIEHLFF